MKKSLLTSIILGTSLLNSSTLEFYQLYKDIHIMKMGGANIGLGGSGTAIFSNPAGLSTMNANNGAEVKVINLSLSINENVINIAKDGLELKDIADEVDKNIRVIGLAKDYLDENNHFEVSNFSYLAKGIKNFNFSFGALTNINLDFKTHRGFGSDGIIDIQGLVLGGAVFGLSYNWSDKLSLGLGTKYIKYASINENFTIGKLIQHKDNLDNYIVNDISKDGESLAFDLGALYKFKNGVQLGFSSMNLGGIGEKSHVTYIPATHNIGVGYNKKIEMKYLKSIRAGFDYTDLTSKYTESDLFKNVKTGVEGTIIDNTLVTVTSGLGFYQGYYSAGISLRLAILELSLTTYAEEIGAYSGQDEDRRYLLNLTVGW